MILKKALIGLLLAGGAVSLVACGKDKSKKTTGNNTTASNTTGVKTTASKTTTNSSTTKSNINYTKDVNVKDLTQKRMTLKDEAKLQNATFGLSFTTAKGWGSDKSTYLLGEELVSIVMTEGADATVYSNDVAVINQTRKIDAIGNIPEEYSMMMPSNMEASGVEYIAATNNYVFDKTIPNDKNENSYIMSNSNNIEKKDSDFDIRDAITPSELFDYASVSGSFYQIDENNFVLYSNTTSPSGSSSETVYDPVTKTSSTQSISFLIKTTSICYYSLKDNGEYQLDYIYVKRSRMSTYVPYLQMYMSSGKYVNTNETVEINADEFEFKLGYEKQTSYADKANFINTFGNDLYLNSVQEGYFTSTFAKDYTDMCPIDTLSSTNSKTNFDFAITLSKDNINNIIVAYYDTTVNPKVLKDEVLGAGENIRTSNSGSITVDLDSISAIKNVKGIEIVTDDNSNKYIKVTELESGYEYKLTIKSSELIKVVESNNSSSSGKIPYKI